MLTASDLMTIQPLVTTPTASLGEVMRYMQADAIRHMPVVDESYNLVGIITDRDVRLAMNSERLQSPDMNQQILMETPAADIMTTAVMTVDPSTPAFEVAESLSTFKFDAMPVVDNKQLVGIVTTTDILDRFAQMERSKVVAA